MAETLTRPGAADAAADVLVAVEGASRKFCRDRRRGLRYAARDAFRDLTGRRPEPALRAGEFWALRDVSFEVRRGESLGIMGVNGAGKSTLLRLILGVLRLTGGRTMVRGRLASLGEHGLAFDPALTGRENAFLSAAVLGIARAQVAAGMDGIVAVAGLEECIDAPVRSYSDGMRARLGFAVAMFLAPDVLLVDEVLAVGDLGFQRRCVEHARRFLDRGGSLILVSHNPHLVQSLCERCLVLDRGRVVFDGPTVGGVARYFEAVQTTPDHPLARDPALLEPYGRVPAAAARRVAASGDDGALAITPDDPGVAIEAFGIDSPGSGSLHSGGPARVFVRYRATAARRIRWGFCLLTADLQTTIACDGRLDADWIEPGGGELAGTIPRLPLAAGRYALRVTVMDPATELPFALGGFGDLPCAFEVETAATVRDNYRRFMKDLIVLDDLSWAHDRQAITASADEPASTQATARSR